MILKQYQESGGHVTVSWKLENWDEDMKQEIEDFSADSGLTINVD
jgi:hypothetical protein